MAETPQVGMMMDAIDAAGNTVTIYSKTGKPYSEAEFSTAMERYNASGNEGNNFLVLKPGATDWMRRNFEKAQEYIQPAIEQVGKGFVGGVTTPLGVLATLAEKAGIVPEGYAAAGKQSAEELGSTVGRLAGGQIKTPGGLGMIAGTALAAPVMAPITSGTGAVQALPLAANMLKAGTAGAAGYTAGSMAAGETFDFGETAQQFGIAALGGGLSSVLGHFITRFVNRKRQESIERAIVDEFKDKYPAIANDPGMLDIAASSPAQISRIVQRGSEGLRGSLDDVANTMLTDIKLVLPRNLSTGQQNTLRAHLRGIASAQNTMLDNIGSDEAFAKAGATALTKTQEMIDFVKSAYPGIKNIEPTALRVNAIMDTYRSSLDNLQQGAQVLHYLKKSGAGEGWNPQTFAQIIRGEYQNPANPMLEKVGNILGGGRPLTQMPQPGTPEPGSEMMRRGYNAFKDIIPLGRFLPNVGYKGPQVPWIPKQPPMQGLTSFASQEAVQAPAQQLSESEQRDAMKQFIRSRR
jgi:hypothetical protein